MAEKNGVPRVEQSLGARARGGNLAAEKRRLYREQLSLVRAKAQEMLDPAFLQGLRTMVDGKEVHFTIEEENLPILRARFVKTMMGNEENFKENFRTWDDEQWKGFCTDYLNMEANRSLGDEEEDEEEEVPNLDVQKDDFLDRLEAATSLEGLEYLDRQRRQIRVPESSSEAEEAEADKLKDALGKMVHEKFIEIARKTFAEGEGADFYKQLDEAIQTKGTLMKEAESASQIFSKKIRQVKEIGEGAKKRREVVYLAPESFSEHLGKANGNIYRWMWLEIKGANEGFDILWKEERRRIAETKEGIQGFFQSRREMLEEQIPTASCLGLHNLSWHDGQVRFIPQRDVEQLYTRYSDQAEILRQWQDVEKALRPLREKRLPVARKERADEEVKTLPRIIAKKKERAEGLFMSANNQGQYSEMAYLKYIESLDELLKEAEIAYQKEDYKAHHALVLKARTAKLIPDGKRQPRKKSVRELLGLDKVRPMRIRGARTRPTPSATGDDSEQVRVKGGEGQPAMTLAQFQQALGKRKKFHDEANEKALEIGDIKEEGIEYKIRMNASEKWIKGKSKTDPESLKKFWELLNSLGWKKEMTGPNATSEAGAKTKSGEKESQAHNYQELKIQAEAGYQEILSSLAGSYAETRKDAELAAFLADESKREEVLAITRNQERFSRSFAALQKKHGWTEKERQVFEEGVITEALRQSL